MTSSSAAAASSAANSNSNAAESSSSSSGLREDQVKNGLSFLQHEKVQSTPLPERMAFLKNKGLTDAEVNEAVRRYKEAGGGGAAASSQPVQVQVPSGQAPVVYQQPPTVVYQPMPQPPPAPEQPLWARVLVPASLTLSLSAGLAFLYKTYVMGEGPFGNRKRFEDMRREEPYDYRMAGGMRSDSAAIADRAGPPTPNSAEAQVQELKRALEAQTRALADLKEVVAETRESVLSPRNITPRSSAVAADTAEALLAEKIRAQETSAIKSELSAIKTLLMANHVAQMTSPVSRGGATPTNARGDLIAQHDVSVSRLEAALSTLDTPASVGRRIEDDLEEKSTRSDVAAEETAETPKTAKNPMDELILAASKSCEEKEKQEEEEMKEKTNEEERDSRMEESRNALANLVAKSEDDSGGLAKAVNILLMYLSNLIKGPEVPRFRRVAKKNMNYVKILKPIEGHDVFLKSVGFEDDKSSGNVFEWSSEWGDNFEAWSKEVLEDAVANLQSLKARLAKEKAAPSAPSGGIPSQQAAKTAASSPAPVSNDARGGQGPTYPATFSEVMQMVQRGETPAGVKQIPDILSKDAGKENVINANPVPSQPKPWEASHIISNGDHETTPFIEEIVDSDDARAEHA